MKTNADLLLKGPYGGFDPANSDYVITDVKTPRPWVNVLANERYGLVTSQVGGGFSWYGNCQLFRLNRWEQDLTLDRQGRFLYFHEDGETWGPTFQPVQAPADYRVRHGIGYTTFQSAYREIEVELTVFVPAEAPCEVWTVKLTNTSGRDRTLRVGFAADFMLGGPGDWHHEFHRLFAEVQVHGETVLAFKHPELREHSDQVHDRPERAFVRIAGLKGLQWTTDKADFYGRYGLVHAPQALLADHWEPQRSGRWDDPCAAGIGEISLAADESAEFLVMIGAGESSEEALRLAGSLNRSWARAELDRVKAQWKDLCSRTSIRTGEPALDLMFNAWLPYQALGGRMIARCAYYQQGGAYGFRDQLQDSLMLLAVDPELTLAQLIRHAEAMYEDGGVRHWWHPGTPIFVESRHSDTCLWLSFGLQAYLHETDDLGALDHTCLFLSRETQRPSASGSLIEHAFRGIDRALRLRSERGLPLIGAGDWNDGLSHAGLQGKGESVWMGMFLFHVLQGWVPFLHRLGMPDVAERYLREAESLRKAVNDLGWDGEWYVAGFKDNGQPFGSKTCTEGRMFLMPQIWSVITGIAPEDRQAIALESVKKHLLKSYGPILLTPAYSQVDPGIGYITRYAPGLRENGGVYSHAACWAIQAFAMAGDTDTALQIVRGMLPPTRGQDDPDLYAAEPYVMPGNSDGPDSPFESRAGWTWYTGSAAWMRRMILEWICGVRVENGDLVKSPAALGLPQKPEVTRFFRGAAQRLD